MPRTLSRILIYTALIVWTIIALFPIFWTFSTTFKVAKDVQLGHIIPWVDFKPAWLGLRAIGLSPDTIFTESTPRAEFLKRFWNSIQASIGASLLALILGSTAAYGLSRFQYRWKIWKNRDISFFFLSQLILPPVVLAMPFLVLYKELALLDSMLGLILIYTLSVLPIVIWIMKDQFDNIPQELEQAALVDGCSAWGAFFRIILPIALPGMVAAFMVIAQSDTSPKPSELATGVSQALVTTVWGLLQAIPAIVAHTVIKNRISRMMLETGITAERLLSRFQSLTKPSKSASSATTTTGPSI